MVALIAPLVVTLADDQSCWAALRSLYALVWLKASPGRPLAEGTHAEPDSSHDQASDRSHYRALSAQERRCDDMLCALISLRRAGESGEQLQCGSDSVKRFLLHALRRAADDCKSASFVMHQVTEVPALLLCAGAAAACSGSCDADALISAFRAAGPYTDLTEFGERSYAALRRAAVRACIDASRGAGGMCACRGALLRVVASEPLATWKHPILDESDDAYSNRVFMVADGQLGSALLAIIPVVSVGTDSAEPELSYAASRACISLAAVERDGGLELVAQSRCADQSAEQSVQLGVICTWSEAVCAFLSMAREWVHGSSVNKTSLHFKLKAITPARCAPGAIRNRHTGTGSATFCWEEALGSWRRVSHGAGHKEVLVCALCKYT